MAQTTQQPILKMEIIDNCICTQHLVGGGEVRVCLIELGPSEGLMSIGVYHHGYCCSWRSNEVVNNVVSAPCLILVVEMELLQVCGPLLMAIILQFPLCLHELQWIMINVDDCLLPKNVMSPLAAVFHNGVPFFVVSSVLMDNIR